jgi:oligopeptide/dipeptide ABC transporter ATP-binding protein
MALLEITDLRKHYGLTGSHERVRALDGVTLSIEGGEVLGVVGESGCGKTTLGRCILQLVAPTSGTVKFKDRDLGTVKGKELRSVRREMQIIFQDPYASLDPRWRTFEILEEPLRVHNVVPRAERKAEVMRLLADVGLPADAAYRYPHEFSGGQRQRIGIARAIALRPDFLIADEPVSALDVSVRAQILNLLLALQKDKGITILFIGHDLGVVRQISQRVAVMYLGIVVEQADADQLFDNPRHPYTRALLSAIPSIRNIGGKKNTNSTSAGEIPSPIAVPTGCRYHTRCSFAQDICESQVPTLAAITGQSRHSVACHFSETLPTFLPAQPGTTE